jgi:hypothetical protein
MSEDISEKILASLIALEERLARIEAIIDPDGENPLGLYGVGSPDAVAQERLDEHEADIKWLEGQVLDIGGQARAKAG